MLVLVFCDTQEIGLDQSFKFSNSNVKLSFSGHETFPFRYGWIPKGVQQVLQYDDLFARDDAVVILGVGKNMVQSILYWTKVLGMVYSPMRGKYEVTRLGKNIFGDDGWDPYLEDPGTLWLLHWRLASRIESASTWYLAFTVWNSSEFTRTNLEDWLLKIAKQYPSTRVTPSSLHRDIDVFLRTYIPADSNRNIMTEDTFDCPLVELGLIEEIEQSGTYRFIRGSKSSLPDLIFLYGLMDYWDQLPQKQEAISFEKLLHSAGSPGAVFKLSENALADNLDNIPSWSGLVFDDTAGMRTVFRRSRNVTSMDILKRYYQEQRS